MKRGGTTMHGRSTCSSHLLNVARCFPLRRGRTALKRERARATVVAPLPQPRAKAPGGAIRCQ
eukprot:7367097-Pyramimonas_sp.AAC.1